jgi:alcohol dehydrogenase
MKTVAAVLRAVTDRRPYGESKPMVLEEVDLAGPRAGEILVRIEAAGVCHSDISVVDGSRVRPLPRRSATRPPGWSRRSDRA